LVNSTLAELDGLHIADKMALIMLSVVLLAVGISHHHSVMTGMSGTALFLFLTTCLHRNRAFANGIRYLTAPTLLNAVALFTWILNFLLPMLNIAKGRAANDDHQTRLTEKYFDHTRYDFVLIFALLLGMGAAYMTWRATGNQVTSLIAPVNPRESSFIAAFLKFLSRCCLPSGGYQSNTRDSSSFLPLVKRCFFKAFHYCCYGAGGPKEEEERLLMIPS